MADKEQIMINGVDVSGCKYYLHNTHKNCGVGLVDCEGKDCIFKQLARKTQEFEQYKKSKQASYETMQREWNKVTLENRSLKKECEGLKERLKILDEEDIVYEITENEFNKMNAYRKALEEIEDICNVADRYELEELQETIFNIIDQAKGEE